MYIYLAHAAAPVLFMLAAVTASSQDAHVESELSSSASPRWQDHVAYTRAWDGAWPQYTSAEDGPYLSSQDQEAQALGGRRLRQGGVTPATVATAQDLIAAVTEGAQHIQITAHLDFSALPVPSNPLYTRSSSRPATVFEHAVYVNSSVTNTLMGACQGPVPAAIQALVVGAPLQPLAPGQCLLLTDVGGIQLLGSGNIWLDNLYLRARYTGRTPTFAHSLLTIGTIQADAKTADDPVAAYITGVQIQGDNVFERAGEVQSVLGVGVAAPTFMSGCSLFHTGGHQETVWVTRSAINIVNSSISDNTMSRGVDFAQIIVEEGGLWMQGTQLIRNRAPVLLRTPEDETGTIVSDTPLEYITTVEEVDGYSRSSPLYTPAPQTPPAGYSFIDGTEGWFASTSQAFPGRPAPSTAFPAAARGAQTRVATAAALQAAVQQGTRHIVVTAHLDLSSLPLVDEGFLLGIIRDSTRSIIGECSEAGEPQMTLPGVPLVPLKPGQCVLVADTELFTLGTGRLWLHNLYLRHKPSQRDSFTSLAYTADDMTGQLWMTACTLQGTGLYDSSETGFDGLYVSGPAYAEGCEFLNLGGGLPAVMAKDAAVRIVNCTVSRNIIRDSTGGVVQADPGSTVWLQGTSVRGNEAVLPLVHVANTDYSVGDGSIFSDRDETVFFWTEDGTLEWRETGGSSPGAAVFLSHEDEWFLAVLEETGQGRIISTAAPLEPVGVTAVRTAKELVDAVSMGVRHIRVLDHIDLRGQGPALGLDHETHLGRISSDTYTITGDCSTDVPSAMLAESDVAARQPGQCAIIVDIALMQQIHGRLWMDNLFIALRHSSRSVDPGVIFCGDDDKAYYDDDSIGGSLWLSRMVVEGEMEVGSDVLSSTAIATYSNLAANAVQVRRTGGEHIPVYVYGTASFEACSFEENVADVEQHGVAFTENEGSVTWFKNVTFADNVGEDIVTQRGGRVFSTVSGLQFAIPMGYGEEVNLQPVPVQKEETPQFLSFSDSWLVAAAKEAGYDVAGVVDPSALTSAGPVAAPDLPGPSIDEETTSTDPSLAAGEPTGNSGSGSGGADTTDAGSTRATPTAAEERTGSSKSDSNNMGVIIAVVLSIFGVIALAIAAVLLVRRRRGRQQRGGDATKAPVPCTSMPGASALASGNQPQCILPDGRYVSAQYIGSSEVPPPPPMHAHYGDSHVVSAPLQQAGGPQACPTGLPSSWSGVPAASGPALWQQQKDPLNPQPHDRKQTPPGSEGSGRPMLPGPPPTNLTTTVFSRPTQSTEFTTTAPAGAGAGGGPAAESGAASHPPLSSAKELLQAELGLMFENKERFLGQYRVLEPEERRVGGQGLVQFMSWKHGAEPVAVKFFLARGAYEAELQLYREGALRSMMPEKIADVPAGRERSVRGYAFPACIVLKKGQSLKDWQDIVRPELETVFDALSHIAQKLEHLHSCGWVHRDLKPGNILRLPHIHSWTLMDFGSAGRIGEQLPGGSAVTTLVYCPPEAVLAKRDGAASFQVQEAADMWALGLISFELLTGKRPFLFMSSTDIQERLCGSVPLMWEEQGPDMQQMLKPLGVLRDTVMACLHRDPAQRPRAAEVRSAWKRIIANTMTNQ